MKRICKNCGLKLGVNEGLGYCPDCGSLDLLSQTKTRQELYALHAGNKRESTWGGGKHTCCGTHNPWYHFSKCPKVKRFQEMIEEEKGRAGIFEK